MTPYNGSVSYADPGSVIEKRNFNKERSKYMRAVAIFIVIAGICFGDSIEFGSNEVPSNKPYCGS